MAGRKKDQKVCKNCGEELEPCVRPDRTTYQCPECNRRRMLYKDYITRTDEELVQLRKDVLASTARRIAVINGIEEARKASSEALRRAVAANAVLANAAPASATTGKA